jgi:hypothetical protein
MSVVWLCDRAQVDPVVADAIDAFCAPDPDAWSVVNGQRSNVLQAADYAQGRTTPGPIITDAKPGQSPHNCAPSEAVDLSVTVNGREIWDQDDPAWQRFLAYVRASPHLHSGADFPGLDDYDHAERVNWRAFCTQSPMETVT